MDLHNMRAHIEVLRSLYCGHNYRMDQVLLKMLSDPDHNQKETFSFGIC